MKIDDCFSFFRLMPAMLVFVCLLSSFSSTAQTDSLKDAEFNEAYNERISKTRINGVYIPEDLEDAFDQLKQLAEPESIETFRAAEEDTVTHRLHFGLGRWMAVNWGFYEGSRYSHYLKQMGLTFPDDMIELTLSTFHRSINGKPLLAEETAAELAKARIDAYEARKKEAEVIIIRSADTTKGG